MFGKNEIVGRSYFKDQPTNTLMLTSRFFTIQGEGPFSGSPAFFVRLTKCSLACSFCDTFFDKGETYTYDEIFEQADETITEFYKSKNQEVPVWALGLNRRIVLVATGGEPTLQTNLIGFLERANEVFMNTQIESNGIQFLDIPRESIYVVSPKCLEKDGKPIRYLKPNSKVLERADCLKFVMSAPDGVYHPYSEVPDWAHRWASETGRPVYVSPMNIYNDEPRRAKEVRMENRAIDITERSEVDERISFWELGLLNMEQNQQNHEYTAGYCMKYGFRLNLQTHLFASLP